MGRGWLADSMTTALMAGPRITAQRGHAVVIGASVAGLATAQVLADRYARVTVLERHAATPTAQPEAVASIVPHGRYPHVLLDGGGLACERMFPGLKQEAIDAGAGISNQNTVRWWSDGWRVKRRRDTRGRIVASRALIESIIRARVEAIANVRIEYGTAIEGLMFDGMQGEASTAAHPRVTGVMTADGPISADLVVDCGGRGSKLTSWLEAAGYPAPPVTEIEVDLCYLAIMLRRRPTDLDGAATLIVQNMAPEMTRLGIALSVEGDRWMVALGGYFGDRPPIDRAGYLAFAESLPVPDLADLLRHGEVIGEPTAYRFRSNRRVHCERARTWPVGIVALGDATCSFNPLYGQGMSVAFMQAEHLGNALDRAGTVERLAPCIQRELAGYTDLAWNIAAGGDLAYPQVVGERPAIKKLIRAYMRKVFRACSVDAEVVDTLFEVTNLTASPAKLLTPWMIARVLRAQRTWRSAQLQTPTHGRAAAAGVIA